MPSNERRLLLARLVDRKRQATVDRYLDGLAAADDTTLTELLAYGSPPLVARYQRAAMVTAGIIEWRRMARRHPAEAAATLTEQAHAADRPDNRLIWQAGAVLPMIADRLPAAAVELAQALVRHRAG